MKGKQKRYIRERRGMKPGQVCVREDVFSPPYMRARRLEIHEVDEHRQLDCRWYDHCVCEADDRGWYGFSCQTCQHYQLGEDAPQASCWLMVGEYTLPDSTDGHGIFDAHRTKGTIRAIEDIRSRWAGEAR